MKPVVANRPILLVEDDDNDILLTLRFLKKSNIKNEVIVFRDGIEALDYLFQSGKYAGQTTILPEIILLDLHLPKVSGMEVLAQVRAAERMRHLPVLVLTGSEDEQDRVDSRNLGTVAYLSKPVDFKNFFKAISQCGIH